MAYDFTTIEKKWQDHWLENRTFAAIEPAQAGDMPKAYVLDMFPYPSGAGLHVGHPEGYTATDITSRYLRMKGVNVLHPMGWDAFGLPAEQYAIKNNVHPADTTRKNIENFRRQIRMLGLSYDWDREINTTDPKYYMWTQWIFLQLFNSYFDPVEKRAMPIGHLIRQLSNDSMVVGPDGSVRLNPTTDGMEQISGEVRIERLWRELTAAEQRQVIDGQRLAYMDEIPVNWCPALGTVLANEEVIDGRSEVGGFPVERRPMRQWMLRITAYADRLIEDLETLDWPQSLKEMQRNWIGRSTGAEVDFEVEPPSRPHSAREQFAQGSEPQPRDEAPDDQGIDEGDADDMLTVFTTRPDTLYGATYMVLAPEHPLVERLTAPTHRETVDAYRQMVASRSERDRMADTKDKTGVFTGAYAVNPLNDERIPIYIADYVLMGYGTGAIMAVPAHDERDFAFAKKFNLPMRAVVMPPEAWLKANAPAAATPPADLYRADPAAFKTAFSGDGEAIHSDLVDGLPTAQARERISDDLEAEGIGRRRVQYKLRDWLFSRQRYWGEPFPILLDSDGNAHALADSDLPVMLPQMSDFKPTGTPEPPLSKAADWMNVKRGHYSFTRETNTMPQWAGSCWYYLRYLDPHNEERFVDPEKEKYWMPVDLYVGGVEHAVLHLLYSRFWHKVLFDLGHVSTPEPFQRLVNQGLILGQTEYHFFEDAQGKPISVSELRDIAEEATDQGLRLAAVRRDTGEKVYGTRLADPLVEKKGDEYVLRRDPSIRVDARSFKMSKSRGNVVNPDVIIEDYGADTFRLYEMYMGPLEAPKPWNTRDIVGMFRFLSKVWRNLVGEDDAAGTRVSDGPLSTELDRRMHRAIKKVSEDIEAMRFNTAIAELIELNNAMTGLDAIPRQLAENFTLLLAPFAPHLAEELWQRLGHGESLARHPWPGYDPEKLTEDTLQLPVQVNGKVRDKITVAAAAGRETVLAAAEASSRVTPWLEGKTIKSRIYIEGKMVSLVTT
jgi:leucyl-tRNA synthetase